MCADKTLFCGVAVLHAEELLRDEERKILSELHTLSKELPATPGSRDLESQAPVMQVRATLTQLVTRPPAQQEAMDNFKLQPTEEF